jgi:membrane associated rhomboid family serine protease
MTETPSHWTTRDLQPKAAINVPWVVASVIAVLVAVHLALWLLGPEWQSWALYAFSFIPERLGGGRVIQRPPGSEVWSFVTYALLHADKFHLLSNCLWLLVFSTPVARRVGAIKYLLLLLLTAAGGALATLALHWGEFVITVGASASVSGVLAAAIPIMFAPGFGPHLKTKQGYAALPVLTMREVVTNPRAIVFTIVFLGLTLFSGAAQMMTGTAFLEERPIAWEAHLGGFVAGLLIFYLLDRRVVSKSPHS